MEVKGKLYCVTMGYGVGRFRSTEVLQVRDGAVLIGMIDVAPYTNGADIGALREPEAESREILEEVAAQWRKGRAEFRAATKEVVKALLSIPDSVEQLRVDTSQARWRIPGAEGRVDFGGGPPHTASLTWDGGGPTIVGDAVVLVFDWGELDMVYVKTRDEPPEYRSLATGRAPVWPSVS